MKHYITPNCEADLIIASLRSECERMQQTKFRESLIENAELIGIVRDEIKQLDRYLANIEQEAEHLANDNEDDLFSRLGDFA